MLMISPRQNKNGVPTTAGSLLLFLASISLVQISLSLLLVTSFTIQHSSLLRVSQQQQYQQQHGLYYPFPTGRTAPATTPVTTTTQLSLFGSNMFGTNDNKKLKDNELATYPSLYTNDDDRTVDGTFDSLSTYLDSWSQLFESSGKGGVLKLTTPVKVLPLEVVASSVSDRNENGNADRNENGNENDDDSVRVVASNGLRLIFQNVDTGYSNKKDEQQQQQKQDNGDDKKKKKPKLQGGVEIVVEKINNDVRVRARRCNFNDETIIKEMSEETIVKELEKAISVWKQQQQK